MPDVSSIIAFICGIALGVVVLIVGPPLMKTVLGRIRKWKLHRERKREVKIVAEELDRAVRNREAERRAIEIMREVLTSEIHHSAPARVMLRRVNSALRRYGYGEDLIRRINGRVIGAVHVRRDELLREEGQNLTQGPVEGDQDGDVNPLRVGLPPGFNITNQEQLNQYTDEILASGRSTRLRSIIRQCYEYIEKQNPAMLKTGRMDNVAIMEVLELMRRWSIKSADKLKHIEEHKNNREDALILPGGR